MTDSSPDFSDHAPHDVDRVRAEQAFLATLATIKGTRGTAAHDAWLSEDSRIARFEAALQKPLPARVVVPAGPPHALVRALQRMKWHIGQSSLGPTLRPIYDRVVRRGG